MLLEHRKVEAGFNTFSLMSLSQFSPVIFAISRRNLSSNTDGNLSHMDLGVSYSPPGHIHSDIIHQPINKRVCQAAKRSITL